MSFPRDPLKVRVELAFGADLSAAPGTWTYTDVSTYSLGSVVIVRGRADETSRVQPTRVTLRLNNADSRFTPLHPMGANYPNVLLDTPLRVSVDYGSGWMVRALAFVDDYDLEFPAPGQCQVAVSASGILARLNQGKTLRSALYRSFATVASPKAVGYWPLEDAAGATGGASAVGQRSTDISGAVTFAADSTFAGSGPLPTLGLGPPNGVITAYVPAYPAATQWAVRYVLRIPVAVATTSQVLEMRTGGTVVLWKLFWNSGTPNTLELKGYNVAGTELLAAGTVAIQHPNATPYVIGEPIMIVVNAAQVSADIEWACSIGWADGSVAGYGGLATGAIGNVSAMQVFANGSLDGITAGHFAVSNSSDFTSDSFAIMGYLAEEKLARFVRLTSEEVAPATSDSAVDDNSVLMGSQSTSKLLDLLYQVEDADGGVLYERTSGVSAGFLTYRTQDQRKNRAIDLALDCGRNEVKVPFQPKLSTQWTHNDITVTRDGGSSARSSDNAINDYPASQTVSLSNDSGLQYIADQLRYLGTISELRVPAMEIDLHDNPTLIPSWVNCEVGSWATVANLPAQFPPGSMRVVLEGWTETFSAVEWRISGINTSPTRGWEVFQFEDSQYGRLESDGSTLSSGPYSATATSLSVATPSGSLWTHADGDFGIDVAGEQMTVTNVTGAASPQTFTVTRSVNGVMKTQLSGAVVQLWRGGAMSR